MKTIGIEEAKNRLMELARDVERGETIVVTRNGAPVFYVTRNRPAKGLRLAAIDEFKREPSGSTESTLWLNSSPTTSTIHRRKIFCWVRCHLTHEAAARCQQDTAGIQVGLHDRRPFYNKDC